MRPDNGRRPRRPTWRSTGSRLSDLVPSDLAIDPAARVHPTADLESGVVVGPRTSIWHRAQVRTGTRIGAECVIGRDVFLDEGVSIGDRVKIQNGALLYHGVTVEDGVFIGPGAILTNDRFPRAVTATGELARAGDWTVSPITLRRGCSIGAGAVVVAGTTVGTFATVGAAAVVTRDVAPHSLVVGNPARALGWVCACGARLVDEHGAPVGATPGPSAPMHCSACMRVYAFESAAEAVRELAGVPAQSGAS